MSSGFIQVRAGMRSPVHEFILHLALALLVLAASWVSFNTAQPVRLPAVSDVREVFRGFNALEESALGSFRWTDGAGTICVPQAGRATRSLLRLSVAGDYALALGTRRMELRAGQADPVSVDLPVGRRHYTLLSGADQQVGADLCLTISSAAVRDPNSDRHLGVPVLGLVASHLPAAGPVYPAMGQLLLNLALAFAAFWLLRLSVAPAWVAALLVTLATVTVVLLLATGLVVAGAGVARYQLPVVGGALAGLAGILGARALSRLTRGLPLIAGDIIAMAYWSLLLLGGLRSLQWVNGHSGVWPLKAGVDPHLTPLVIIPILLFALWIWAVLRALTSIGRDEGRKTKDESNLINGALILLGAVAIPVALEVSIFGWDSLYAVFRDSPYDYQRDVPRVGSDPLGFLRDYVTIAPTLSLHSSTHPPGAVLLLWAIVQIFGPGAVATSWMAILLSALSALAALWLGWRIGGPQLALLAGAIYVAMPGHTIFSVTSMDGVFNAIIALGAVAFFLSMEPAARRREAALAGLLIALGLCFTYTVTQLFFFGAAVALMSFLRGWLDAEVSSPWPFIRRRALFIARQGLIAAGTIVVIFLAIGLLTGFNVLEAAPAATAENTRFAGRQVIEGPLRIPFLPPSFAFYLDFLGANAIAYLWYVAPWGLAALSALPLAALSGRERFTSGNILLVAVAVCALGMLLSGLFNREVERIWGFTYPLIAVLVARHAWQGQGTQSIWRAGLYVTLFFAMSALIKLLLNTAW